jgi:chromosome segregation ATPase
MKRISLGIILVVLTVSLLSGCGVSKDSYDAALKTSADTQAQMSKAQADLSAAQGQLGKSNSDLAAAQRSLASVSSERDLLKTQLDKAMADLAAAQKASGSSASDLAQLQQAAAAASSERDAARSQLDKANSDLSAAQQSLSTLNASVKSQQTFLDVTIAYLNAKVLADSGADTNSLVVAMQKVGSAVAAAQDSSLKAAWDAIVAASQAQGQTDAAEGDFMKVLAQKLADTKPKTN